MTNREFFSAVANNTINDAVIAHAKAQLSKIPAKADHSAMVAELAKVLADHTPRTAREIVDLAIEGVASTSMATVVAKEVPNVVIGETVAKGRVVKTYTLA